MKKITILIFTMLVMSLPAMAGELNLSVAASLKEVISELTASYTAKHPGTLFLKNFGPSGTLAGQIENGGPADIFIAANTEWVDYLNNKKLVDSKSIKTFTCNSLVFAGSTGKKVTSMKDLVKLEKIAIGSPKSVPAGEYAMAAMTKAGVFSKLTNKLVMAKDVRECLMYAELGEVDGAFVYKTDALLAKKARLLFTVPQELYPRVVYPMALTNKAAQNKEAKAFIAYLQGKEAKAVLTKFGFILK
ncbi:molybdate ABC transporter substrate-binding protein [Chlorobium sp. BLA1]|uniref:molybdate ABC transporter substrate-binding protein n=1 Tax=Candidatus Chlorobium masyuteum TaxID=2716876 RepID=UPI00141EE26A|nr:molybdate ABC transporter substrate-binding protein [Candidatus Chlorobium masyuteum]NHQ60211.1 molybdate ABC transporter substrate-binding protein [Candidatus Chlorobium masyuteum]